MSSKEVKLIVGLGNPGQQYSGNRHNIGQMVMDHFSFSSELKWSKKFKGSYCLKDFGGKKIYFLIPETYMNLSGESVLPLAQFYKILPQEVLVLHDELDLPFGKLVFKFGGGLAGHNGLKSISHCFGTQDFMRIRLGISRPIHGDVKSHVLSDFSSQEKPLLKRYLSGVGTAIELAIKEGFDKAAASFSQKNFILD